MKKVGQSSFRISKEHLRGVTGYQFVFRCGVDRGVKRMEIDMNSIIYIVGLIVVVGAILSFVGLA
ncbi:hypothetical protein G6L28_08835 [Agrobacterium larrymoorei]|uniref:hypothetical protein n=1 Tax=Agrobacterium larrymoorei TaxID=160699 RepID=UPI001574995D|nr:hypothetical protein [Agrobacterium larrymoorei]NTJ42696.1 hypothetical protein [Agrobacterium larrymoorei]